MKLFIHAGMTRWQKCVKQRAKMLSPAIAIAAKQKNNLIPLPLPCGGFGIRSQSESGKYLEMT